jgi:hypothetical protein
LFRTASRVRKNDLFIFALEFYASAAQVDANPGYREQVFSEALWRWRRHSRFTEHQKRKIASPLPRKKGEKPIVHSKGNLSFKRRGILLEIKELVGSASHHAAKPKRLGEHLFKTTHNCIPGFIRDSDRQPGLVAHIIV